MKPLVLVRGGGDIASGAIYRLKRAGYKVIVNEIAIPTMIRREVCYGNAVHRGEMVLERFVARHVGLSEVQDALENGVIPVVTNSYETVLEKFKPQVVVDGILAKRNVGTKMTDAPLVVAVGPGFVAGEDVHVVVETMRGHRLGRCIYDGAAEPDTGIPGEVGGFTHERVTHSPGDGLFTAKRHISDHIQANEVIGYVEEEPVRAKITGVLRGILKSGLMVTKGFKLADVDGSCKEAHCFSISDKSLSVGGGVMEAITAWEYEESKGE